MRILQLSPQFPFPPDEGGKIGIANIYKNFSKSGAEVTFFSFEDPKKKISAEHIQMAEEFGRVVLFTKCTTNTKLRIIKSFLTHTSIYLKKHINNDVKEFFNDFLNKNEFDIIHVDHTGMMPLGLYIQSIIKKPLGLRLHNVEYMIWKRYGERLGSFNPLRLYINQQAVILRKAEKELIEKADICFAVSVTDEQRAKDLNHKAKIITANAGVSEADWHPDKEVIRNQYEMIHATVYSWIHNSDAIKWFIEKVLPLVKNQQPEATLTLLGRNAPYWLRNYTDIGVNPVGYVDRVQPYLNRANIYIAPLFVGSGIRIKILEAMAMELPVIATRVSAEGIYAREEDGLFIVENEIDFSNKIIELSRNFEKARELGRKAREFVLQNFTWEQSVKIMFDEYKKLTNK
jgi:glycosyltransferase involved in cell wall biosynthesis